MKPKKPVRRSTKRATSSPAPEPMSATESTMEAMCGHSGCGTQCRVRYVGPTSRIHDHHIVHTARGVSHVWTAAVVAGLAVVLTGAFAFSSVQAESTGSRDAGNVAIQQQLNRMEKRLTNIEQMLKKHVSETKPSAPLAPAAAAPTTP